MIIVSAGTLVCIRSAGERAPLGRRRFVAEPGYVLSKVRPFRAVEAPFVRRGVCALKIFVSLSFHLGPSECESEVVQVCPNKV